MQYYVKCAEPQKQRADCLVVGIFAEQKLSAAAKQLNELSSGYLAKILRCGDMTGESGQTLLLHDVSHIPTGRILLMGCGKESEFNEIAFCKVIAKSVAILKPTSAKEVVYYLTDLPVKDRDISWKIRITTETIADNLYTFDQLKSKKKSERNSLHKIIFNVLNRQDLKLAEQALREAKTIVEGINLTKDLGNLPANICTPNYIAKQAEQLAKDNKTIKTTVLDEKVLKKLGMGALLAVASGSYQSAKLVVMEYYGAAKNNRPIVLVGKGVTFDTGGISLKPAAGMEEMKFDMCGAASILGTFKALAELKLAINVVGIIPTTENMPGGGAIKPGDIVTSMSGQTIEILNTDAEGRLILCDALTYSEKFNPAVVIDIATLTGGVIIALGSVASGLMGNHEPLIEDLQKAAQKSGDRVWALPLWEEYYELNDSNVADMANLGAGNGAKSIAAACFLARFAKKFHWAHLDIAGTAWKSGKDKTATGRPVALLVQYLLDKSTK